MQSQTGTVLKALHGGVFKGIVKSKVSQCPCETVFKTASVQNNIINIFNIINLLLFIIHIIITLNKKNKKQCTLCLCSVNASKLVICKQLQLMHISFLETC